MSKFFIVTAQKDDPELVQAKEEIISHLGKKRKLTDHPSKAEMILVLGGDGTMLKAIRKFGVNNIPFCGLNFGHTGFLLNEYIPGVLEQILGNKLNYVTAPLLKAQLYDRNGTTLQSAYAFNDIVMERSTANTAKITIKVGAEIYVDPLVCDGIIVSTAAGSTAYNASAGGVIVPIETNSLLITASNPAIFHAWKCAQISAESKVMIEARELDKRPVRLVADGDEIPNAVKAEISYSNKTVRLAFVTTQDFRRKVLDLQFRKQVKGV